MEEEAREYFLQVEAYYQEKIGRPLILSPKDVEAVTQWWEQGVPLEAALRGLDGYLERLERDPRRRRRRIAVRYARNEVLDAAEDLRTARVGDRRGEGVEDLERLTGVLNTLAERLKEAARGEEIREQEDLPALLEGMAREMAALGASLEGEEIDAGEAEECLAARDTDLMEAVRRAVGDEVLAEVRVRAEAGLADMRTRMEEKAWRKTVALLEEKLLRERFVLPRLSLYGY